MERELLVYVDLAGVPVLAGKLWSRALKGRESASFEYEASWRQNAGAFSLDPTLLRLGPGTFHTPTQLPLFNAFADGAPDRWGRMLMHRAARRKQNTGRTLFEIDFLTLVDDEARQGAYRYRELAGGDFLAPPGPQRIPPLVELPRLLNAVRRVLDDNEADEDLRLLVAPGSSLGGARPKASVRDNDGSLLIAKFPHKDDALPTNEWEHVAMVLAERAGVRVASSRLETVENVRIVLHRRFDRNGIKRMPFVSALTMLGARDNENHSYLEIADAIRQMGSNVRENLEELWRRMVFNVLVSNTDDHLRNHGFLWNGDGWQLSPAYDLNPTPPEIRPRFLALAIDEEDATASIDLALSVAAYFDLKQKEAQRIVQKVNRAVATWRDVAKSVGLSAAQLRQASNAFIGSG